MRRALRAVPAADCCCARADRDLGAVRRPRGRRLRSILPPPHAVASSLYNDRSLLWRNFLVTAQEVLLGILVAAVIGAGAGDRDPLLADAAPRRLPAARRLAGGPDPAVRARCSCSGSASGSAPKLVVVALVSFFSIVVTTLAGLAAVDPDLLKLMRTFDASRLTDVPARRAAVGPAGRVHRREDRGRRSVIGAVFAEQHRLELRRSATCILQSRTSCWSPRACAAIVILSLFAIALFALLTLAERLALPWAYQPARRTARMKRLLALAALAVARRRTRRPAARSRSS